MFGTHLWNVTSLLLLVACVVCAVDNTLSHRYYLPSYPEEELLGYEPISVILPPDCNKDKEGGESRSSESSSREGSSSESSSSESSSSESSSSESSSSESSSSESSSSESSSSDGSGSSEESKDSSEEGEQSKKKKEKVENQEEGEKDSGEKMEESKEAPTNKKSKGTKYMFPPSSYTVRTKTKYVFPPNAYAFPASQMQQGLYNLVPFNNYIPYRSSYVIHQPQYPPITSYQYASLPRVKKVKVQKQ